MKKVVLGAAAITAIAAGGIGFASWSGGQVTTEMQSQTAKLIQQFPVLKLIDQKVTKGLMRSTHELTLEIGCDNNEAADAENQAKKVQITWRDHIRHGPIPGGTSMGLASIDSELVLPPEVASKVAEVFGNAAPLKIHTVLGFGGGYVTEITSPALKYDNKDQGQFDWQGLTLVLKGSVKGGLAAGGSYTFDMPGFTFVNVDDNGSGLAHIKRVQLGKVSMQGQVQPTADPALWMQPQKSEGAIAAFAIDVQPRMGQPMVNMALSDLKFSSNSQIDKGLLSSSGQTGGKLNVNGFAVDKFDMQASMKNVHAQTYQQIIHRTLSKLSSCQKPLNTPEQAKADLDETQKDTLSLLSHDPEYSLDKLTVEIGGKTAELSYKLGTRGIAAADGTAEINQLLMKGYLASTAKIQTAWIEKVVQNVLAIQSEGKSTPEQLTQVMTGLNAAIDNMVAKGVLIRDADTLKTTFNAEAGQFTLNDKPTSMAELMDAVMAR